MHAGTRRIEKRAPDLPACGQGRPRPPPQPTRPPEARRALDRSRLHGCDALGGGVEGAGGERDNAAEVEVLTEMASTPLWRGAAGDRRGRQTQGATDAGL